MTINLAVSTVIFALRPDANGKTSLWIPLVKRIRDPFEGSWALPGGPLRIDEDLDAASARTLLETTGLEPRYLEQLYAFGDLDRSPVERVVSIVYWALVRPEETESVFETENVHWFEADELGRLAFDHNLIVDYALWRLRNKMEYSRIAHGFLGETFTLAQLREVYEVVLQRPQDPGNFRRMMDASGTLVATGQFVEGSAHRPPQLYRYDETVELTDLGPIKQKAKR